MITNLERFILKQIRELARISKILSWHIEHHERTNHKFDEELWEIEDKIVDIIKKVEVLLIKEQKNEKE